MTEGVILKVESPQSERISLQAFESGIGSNRTGWPKTLYNRFGPPTQPLPNTGRYPVPDSDCFVMLMRDSAWDVPTGLLLTGRRGRRSSGAELTSRASYVYRVIGSCQKADQLVRLPGGESGQHHRAVTSGGVLE